MPCWSLFESQPAEYRESVLPKAVKKRVTVEAGTTMGWDRWAGTDGVMIGINHFGASAPGEVIMEKFGFTVGAVSAAALRLMGKEAEAKVEEASTETAVAGPTLAHGH